jgi:hypothetical protein
MCRVDFTRCPAMRAPLMKAEVRLLPNRSSQRLIDPVLPAGAGFLEVFKHVLIDTQRDQLLDARESRFLRKWFRRLSCCGLECCLGSLPRVDRSSCSISSHFEHLYIAAHRFGSGRRQSGRRANEMRQVPLIPLAAVRGSAGCHLNLSLGVDRLHRPRRRYVANIRGRCDRRPIHEPNRRIAEVVPP